MTLSHNQLRLANAQKADEVTHKQRRQDLILPRQIINPILNRERLHDIQQGHKSGDLHREPGDSAWYVETTLD